MPRNSGGTYTLPVTTNPVVPGTKVQSNWANSSLSDVAAALTDSLSRGGSGGMAAPLKLATGSAAVPALSFTAETGSGLYRAGAGDVRLAVAGVDVLKATAAGVTVPAGDVTLTAAAQQGYVKSGGTLLVGTSDVNTVSLVTGNLPRFSVSGTTMTSAGGTITGLPTPTNASDAAIKSYVDGVDGTAGVTAGPGFAINSVKLTKIGATLVLLRATVVATATVAAGVTATLIIVPAGYRPAAVPAVVTSLWDSVAATTGACAAQTSGAVTSTTGITNGNIYSFSMAFAI